MWGGQILTSIASALHCCKKMQSRQKVSLAGLLEITWTQFVSCGAGDWALWPEYGRRKRICCDTYLFWVHVGWGGYPPVSTSRVKWSLATLATGLWCLAAARAIALTVFLDICVIALWEMHVLHEAQLLQLSHVGVPWCKLQRVFCC